eukprot:14253278-Heterocapsa_arctica.AAC.1
MPEAGQHGLRTQEEKGWEAALVVPARLVLVHQHLPLTHGEGRGYLAVHRDDGQRLAAGSCSGGCNRRRGRGRDSRTRVRPRDGQQGREEQRVAVVLVLPCGRGLETVDERLDDIGEQRGLIASAEGEEAQRLQAAGSEVRGRLRRDGVVDGVDGHGRHGVKRSLGRETGKSGGDGRRLSQKGGETAAQHSGPSESAPDRRPAGAMRPSNRKGEPERQSRERAQAARNRQTKQKKQQ